MRPLLFSSFLFLCGFLVGTMRPREQGAPVAEAPQSSPVASVQTEQDSAPSVREDLDGPQAWEKLTAAGTKPQMTDIQTLAREWASKDGHAAASFGLTITDPLLRAAFLEKALPRWFGREPDAFLAWLKQQQSPASLVSLVNYIEYHQLLKQNVASLDHILALHEGNARQAPFANFSYDLWRREDQREEVLAWLRRQPESDTRDMAWKQIAADLARTDAAAAAALAPEVSAKRWSREVTSTVAARLAKEDPAKAFAFVEGLQDESARSFAWQSVIGTWALSDPKAVLDHLRKNLSSVTTELLQPLASTCFRRIPAAYLQLLRETPGGEESRESITRNVLLDWSRESRDDARRWLNSAEASWISPEALKSCLRQVDMPPSLGGGGSQTIQGRRVWFSY